MITSNWGDWFVSDEIEAADPDGLSVWYLGCNGFVVRSPETTLYIDPYFGNGDPPRLVRMIPVPLDPAAVSLCDAVLVTHEHLDHMHPPSCAPILENTDANLHAPASGYESAEYDGDVQIPAERRNVVEAGDSIPIGDVTVHVRETDDPDSIESVGYVIEHDSGTFFNAGDARPGPEFEAIGEEFDIDLGALAFGTRGIIPFPESNSVDRVQWYQTENEVIESAGQLGLDRLLPCHFDMWKGVKSNPGTLCEHRASHSVPRTVDIVEIGDRVDVDRAGVVPLQSLDRQ